MTEKRDSLTTVYVDVVSMMHGKSAVKKLYVEGKIGLSDAVSELMFDYGMDRGDVFKYLGP